jgi:uncharacterized protein
VLFGLLSDTHGNLPATRRAIGALTDRGADLLLHLGDVGDERVIDLLAGIPARVVFGNCDDDRSLTRYAEALGLTVDHPLGRFEADGRSVAFTHGHEDEPVKRAFAGKPDYFLHGHTHQVRDERIGSTRVINPGALFRARRYSVALLDPGRDHVEWIEVAR